MMSSESNENDFYNNREREVMGSSTAKEGVTHQIGKLLRKRRIDNDQTLWEAALALEMDWNTYSRYERGGFIPTPMIKKFADYLECHPAALTGSIPLADSDRDLMTARLDQEVKRNRMIQKDAQAFIVRWNNIISDELEESERSKDAES
tara:strand:- start:1059 stop:1505 length:447 start_codon:yes stop_codon:yes gene_type:complete